MILERVTGEFASRTGPDVSGWLRDVTLEVDLFFGETEADDSLVEREEY